jgi:hypothetical protein
MKTNRLKPRRSQRRSLQTVTNILREAYQKYEKDRATLAVVQRYLRG